MAAPHRSDERSPGDHVDSRPPVLRLRLVPWDVSCAVALLATLLVVATATDWYSGLFGFLKDVCAGACPSAPLGVDFYIYPVVWGGLGAAVAAAVLGPVVSLLKGWYLSFWPVLAIALVLFASAAGAALTDFSSPYWHDDPGVVDVGE
ncbi:MAG TPA: hypothetical protein VGI49_06545 [Mycobacterium sp.]|jgi:hypothetical protein